MAYDTRHVRTRSRKRTLRRRATVSNRLDTLHASCVLSITVYGSVPSRGAVWACAPFSHGREGIRHAVRSYQIAQTASDGPFPAARQRCAPTLTKIERALQPRPPTRSLRDRSSGSELGRRHSVPIWAGSGTIYLTCEGLNPTPFPAVLDPTDIESRRPPTPRASHARLGAIRSMRSCL